MLTKGLITRLLTTIVTAATAQLLISLSAFILEVSVAPNNLMVFTISHLLAPSCLATIATAAPLWLIAKKAKAAHLIAKVSVILVALAGVLLATVTYLLPRITS